MLRHHKHLHSKKHKEPFDYVVYFFTIATPLFELPQAYAIFSNHSAAGVSIWTWGFFCLAGVVWMIYAIRHKLLPLLVTNILYLVIESAIVVGIFMYS